MSEALLEAVRGLHVADPELGVKPLLAKLREQQPDVGTRVRRKRESALNPSAYSSVLTPSHYLGLSRDCCPL